MIGWLLDLIFSNLWLLIILYWIFRLFSKGFKEGMREPSRPQQPEQKSRRTVEVAWETDLEYPVKPALPASTKSDWNSEPAHRASKPNKAKERPIEEERGVPLPVQGMIWSQVYGPPRSKNPHHSRKTR